MLIRLFQVVFVSALLALASACGDASIGNVSLDDGLSDTESSSQSPQVQTLPDASGTVFGIWTLVAASFLGEDFPVEEDSFFTTIASVDEATIRRDNFTGMFSDCFSVTSQLGTAIGANTYQVTSSSSQGVGSIFGLAVVNQQLQVTNTAVDGTVSIFIYNREPVTTPEALSNLAC